MSNIPLSVDEQHANGTPVRHTKEETALLIKKWDADPAIIEQLPIVFNNGARLDVYEACCGVCDKYVPPGDFRGSITYPIPSVAVVEALAGCVECNTITHYLHRVRDDLSLQWQESNGEWVTAKMRARGRKDRMMLWLKNAKRRLLGR